MCVHARAGGGCMHFLHFKKQPILTHLERITCMHAFWVLRWIRLDNSATF
eukprot:COSAG02_NODE_1981_length_10196_cov_11.415668_9_plen_50_part_00